MTIHYSSRANKNFFRFYSLNKLKRNLGVSRESIVCKENLWKSMSTLEWVDQCTIVEVEQCNKDE